MSTSVNVHPTTTTDENRDGNRLLVTAKTDAWPRNLRLEYKQGGPGIAGNHETCVFIGSLTATAIRELATNHAHVSDQLFAYARWLDEHGNDSQES